VEDRADGVADDPRWNGLRAGDRWASVRSDDRGREVRMGERRATVRSDADGTEMRMEDRWAQVRREDARYRGQRREPEAPGFAEDTGGWSDSPWSRHSGPPALPASGPEPASSWAQSWRDDRDREPVRGRWEEERDDRWEREDTGRGPRRPRRSEFELNDERWR
jgi:hypothetical protein